MRKGKIGIVIQARMGSSRLPNKAMLSLGGKPVVQRTIESAKRVVSADTVIVAVPWQFMSSQPIIYLAEQLEVATVTGQLYDVHLRFQEAIYEHDLDIVVRLTADCPFIPSYAIEEHITTFLYCKDLDYISNGKDIEVFTTEAFLDTISLNLTHDEREHVTKALYTSGKYNTFNTGLTYPNQMSIDTMEDYIKAIEINMKN